MSWSESKTHFILATCFLAFDLLLVFGAILLLGLGSSGDCNEATTISSAVVRLIPALLLLTPLVIAIRALIIGRYARFSRTCLYFFLSLLFVLPILVAATSGGRCVPHDVFLRERMLHLQISLKEYRSDMHVYPSSLDALIPRYLNQMDLSDYHYQALNDSYSICTTIRKRYFYGIPLNKGEQFCVDPTRPAFGMGYR